MKAARFIPAARFHFLTPFFDTLAEVFGLGRRFKRRLLAAMTLPQSGRVLDVGSGTGQFAILLARERSDLLVDGIDADPAMVRIAERRTDRDAVQVRFHQGLAQALPFPDGAFDVVTSLITFHHLSLPDKRRAMAEVARVLKPGGTFYLADFAPPRTPIARAVARGFNLFGFEHTRGHFDGTVSRLLAEAGLISMQERWWNHWSISLLEMTKKP